VLLLVALQVNLLHLPLYQLSISIVQLSFNFLLDVRQAHFKALQLYHNLLLQLLGLLVAQEMQFSRDILK
jgi:hypothetical protein